MKINKYVKVVISLLCIILIAVNIYFVLKIINEKNNKDDIENSKMESMKDSEVNIEVENVIKDNGENIVRVLLNEDFYYEAITDKIKARINGISYKENDKINYDELRYVTVKYYDFNHEIQIGELIVNVCVADDVLEIFKELYDNEYEIEKIRLIDDYNGNDDASMADNNSSAFNFRNIDGTEEISDHSYGVAIDINPLYNPYVRQGFGDRDVLPVNGVAYADRESEFAHKIVKGDVCYQAFINRGWKWGGDWDSPKDYQHFYKEIAK